MGLLDLAVKYGAKYGAKALSAADLAPELRAMREMPRSVMPAPQRFFDPADKAYKPFLQDFGATPGGRYLQMQKGSSPVDITGQRPASAMIGVTPEGMPQMRVSDQLVEQTGSQGAQVKTNLFKKKAGWNWVNTPEGYDPNPGPQFPLVSVESRGQHYYTLNTEFPAGVDLKRYEKSATEPRLRPTTTGDVYLGNPVGTIKVRGKEHPVFDKIVVRSLAPIGMTGGLLGMVPQGQQE